MPEPFPEALLLVPGHPARAWCPVNQAQSAGGLDIALVALERHDGGARLGYMCHASDARTRGEMRMLDVIAVDDSAPALPRGPHRERTEGNRLRGQPGPGAGHPAGRRAA